jgi:hypothetical protein
MAKRFVVLAFLFCLLLGCGPEPTVTPDLVATKVAVDRAAAATLTAGAPPSPAVATEVPTVAPPPAPTATPTTAPTVAPQPSNTPPPPPTSAPAPTTPPIAWRPDPYAVVGVRSDDVLNVRAGPGVGYDVVGSIPFYGMGVQVGETGQEVGEALWLPAWYRGIEGWANSHYLARQVGSLDEGFAAKAVEIIAALKDHDMESLAASVHPDKGLRFSPYTFVRDEYLVFTAAELPDLWSDPAVYTWGVYEGLGGPIELTFQGYYDDFVYDADFFQPQVLGLNQIVGRSSMINNIAEFYPGSIVVEYHFEGFDPQYVGYDWLSLRLVLQQQEGFWYLVAIVHDEWTP